jgi:hypothetical protein
MDHMTDRGRSRSRPALLEFRVADIGEAVSCAPTFKEKVANWQNHPQHPIPDRNLSLEDIKRKLERAHLQRKVRRAARAQTGLLVYQ